MIVKHRIYEIMERAEQGDRASRVFDLFIVSLIALNVAQVIIETVDEIAQDFGPLLAWFEFFSVIVFTIEYLLRLWSCTSDVEYRSSFGGRVRFALSGFALVDLMAIAPFYLQLFLNLDPSLVGAVRLFRLFRLFKMGRYIRSIRVLGSVVSQKRKEMYLVATVLIIVLIMISSLMYYVENEAQPEAFSSIPAAMWWGMVTLTTIGYGDVYPITALGKFFGILVAMLGIGMFALPAGILSSGFVEALARETESTEAGEETVRQFVDAINRHNVDEMMSLMAAEHRMIGTKATEIVKVDQIREAWEHAFERASEYSIIVRTITSRDDRVLLSGFLKGLDSRDSSIPAAWEARIENSKITEWRMFADLTTGMDPS